MSRGLPRKGGPRGREADAFKGLPRDRDSLCRIPALGSDSLAIPVVQLFAEPGDEAEPDEEHLAGSGVVADLAGSRVPYMRSVIPCSRPRTPCATPVPAGRATTEPDESDALRPIGLPQQEVAVTLEDDEDLLLGRVAVGRCVELSGKTSACLMPVRTEPASRPG